MSVEWPGVFEAEFGRKLTDSEVQSWDGEFTAAFPGITAAEIIPHIRSTAAQWQDRAPCGCKDIIATIRRARERDKDRDRARRTEPRNANGCKLCAGGWIDFWSWYEGRHYPSGPVADVSFGDAPDAPGYVCLKTSMACTCSEGDRYAARTLNGAVQYDYSALRQKVSRLRREYLGLKAAQMEGVEESTEFSQYKKE